MQIKNRGDYAYIENGITEDFGWTKWYDWSVVKRHTGIINIFLALAVAIGAFALRQYLAKDGIFNLFISLIAAVLVWLFIITPIHELLHLLPLAGFRLDEKCVITIGKGTVSAIYNGKTTKFKECISIILPIIVLTVILLPLTMLCTEQIRIFMIFLFYVHIRQAGRF